MGSVYSQLNWILIFTSLIRRKTKLVRVSGHSMHPSFVDKSYIIMCKVLSNSDICVGDVVTFFVQPGQEKFLHLKRVIEIERVPMLRYRVAGDNPSSLPPEFYGWVDHSRIIGAYRTLGDENGDSYVCLLGRRIYV